MALNRNNSFYANGLRSERDKFGIEQELDRIRNSTKPAYTTPDKNLYRSPNAGSAGGSLSNVGAETGANASTGVPTADEVYENYRKQVNNWFGTGNRVNLGDVATKAWNTNGFDINTTPYAKWSNYGSGGIFKDDYKMNETNDAVKGYYNNTKNLADSEYENYKRMAEQIARQGDAITAANSKAYIAKQQQLKNSREQNMAMGRGGLGTSEAGYNRINTAYENQRNATIKNGNEIADDTLQAYEDFIKATRVQAGNYENAARDTHSKFVIEGLENKLLGNSDGELGIIDPYLKKDLKYSVDTGKDEDGDKQNDMEEKVISQYLELIDEGKLKDEVNNVRNNNKYFFDDRDKNDADTIFNKMHSYIEQYGSKNEDYQNYLKWDTEQKRIETEKKAQAELVAPENYANRGAVANVAQLEKTKLGKIVLNGAYYSPGVLESSDLAKLSKQGKIHALLKSKFKNAVSGDIVYLKETGKYYMKSKANDNWSVLNRTRW